MVTWQAQVEGKRMKTHLLLLCCFVAFSLQAQFPSSGAESDPGYSVVERGPNYQTWRKVTRQTNDVGEFMYHTNFFVELATGLNRQENGEWVESTPEIVIAGNRALARGAGHEAIFAGNVNTTNAIQIKTPEGLWLKGRVFGIAYHDVASGTNVLIGELRNTAGERVGTNIVRYPDAFTGLKADIQYTYKRAGLEQDVVFRAPPPRPQEFGLNPATTHLLVLTEFTESPNPTITSRQWTAETERVEDQTLAFGSSMQWRKDVPSKFGMATPKDAGSES